MASPTMTVPALESDSSSVTFKVVAVGEDAGGTKSQSSQVQDKGACEGLGPQARLEFQADGEWVSHKPRSIQSHPQLKMTACCPEQPTALLATEGVSRESRQ